MKIAVIAAVYNESANIERFLDHLLKQSRQPDEIILVDDGSTDDTAAKIEYHARNHSFIRLLKQANAGPASARNQGWRVASSEICLFTDGDCVPDLNWIEKIEQTFLAHPDAGGAAGTYRTLNAEKKLAQIIGFEITWRYQHRPQTVDAHGAYNLAVKKSLLEKIGGFDEKYPVPSGEDWDLTYKVSQEAPIYFVPDAIVGHYHPDDFIWYLRNQERRAFDRVRVYKDHPMKKRGDSYTGASDLLQIAFGGIILATWPLSLFSADLLPLSRLSILALLVVLFPRVFFILKQSNFYTAIFAAGVFFTRSFAWFLGAARGIIQHGLPI